MNRRGFTLLELLVATSIMALAVVGLLSNLSTSMRNAAKLTDYDRAALLARRQMDTLLLDPTLTRGQTVTGTFDAAATGGVPSGWQARLSLFEQPPMASTNAAALERIDLEVWWEIGGRRRTVTLEAYRRTMLTAEEAGQ